MNCLDCDKPIRANAKRCTLCSARHYMEMRTNKIHLIRKASRPIIICKNEACKVEFVPKIVTQTYCTEACKNRAHARKYQVNMTGDQRARKNEEARRYRARLKAAQDGQKARELAKRIERINAKAQQMMSK